jgi:hypothetical protein
MKKIKIALIALLTLAISSCSGVYYSKQDSQALSRGVYATKSAIEVSRVDLAKKYIVETAKIVVPPAKPIVVTPLVKKNKDKDGVVTIERVVVLPEAAPANTVRVNSDEFKELMKDKETLANYVKGEEVWKSYSEEVDAKIRQDAANALKKDDLIKKQETKIKSLVWYRNIVIGSLSFVGILILLYVFSLLVRAGIAGARVVS